MSRILHLHKSLLPEAALFLLAAVSFALPPASAGDKAASASADRHKAAAAGSADASRAQPAGIPDARTVLPPPEVEMDIVAMLATFPKQDRPYVQQIAHTAKDLSLLNRQCAQKAEVFAQKGLPKATSAQELDLAGVSKFNQGYMTYFDPLRTYLKLSYRRLYDLKPPARFEKAHKYWLAYVAYALENLDYQRFEGKMSGTRPRHSPVEVAQYRAWAYRLFKDNGLDLTPYMVR